MTEEEFELKLSRMKDLYLHRITFEKMPSNHEAIPFCDGSGRDACVACSEEVDKCVPFPCEKVDNNG